jgi:MFS transporter, DHA3 family, macrolide efflux protein
MAYETGNLSGMALAGLVVAMLGGVAALYLNAGLFILAGISAMLMRRSDFAHLKKVARQTQGFVADFVAGLRYILTHRNTSMLYVLQLIMICTWMSAPVIMAPYAKTVLHASVTEFGYIEACMGIGLLLGGVLTPWLKEHIGFFNTVLLYSLLQMSGFILLSLFTSILLSKILYAIIGFGFTVWAVIMTEAQSRTDLDFQGRVQSTFFSISGLFVIVVYGALALIGDSIALQYVFMLEVVLLLLGIALLFWVRKILD